MSRLTMTPFLRNVLRVDAVLSGLTALALMADADQLAAWTGLPAAVLTGIGVALLPWTALLAWLSGRTLVATAAVGAVVALNFVWMLDCAMAAFGAFGSPLGLGIAMLTVQAVGTFVIAELEWIGMRRASRSSAAHGERAFAG
ncbi:MAG TPA: hypothetical protein VFY73_09135 [Ideonella sp.]|uniref:hypothetical protein n=1 Tax=Ideonella sp. TaxID=1929293 RepID=UPI002E363433|nr:hypothetical protein [Ideonella sp.]HEX5684187.1 hypothetical protein [Ideonella sp.]